jgi:beta-lactamase regulating signal transducer with metallopeptidase domain
MTYSMEVLGWTLVHFCWQATAIALVYRIADGAFGRSRSHVRYSLALLALLSMFAAALATFVYEGLHAAPRETSATAIIAKIALQEKSDVAIAATETAIPQQNMREVLAERLVNAMPWMDGVWMLGVLILTLRTAGGWWLLRRLSSSGLIEVPAEVSARFSQIAKRIGIRRKIDLFISEQIPGPMTLGALRSVILLPVSAITHLSPEQLEVVLAHELAHIRRNDYLWNMVQTMVETLFFFHPAVWWVSGSLRQQRELCCDDVALACCTDPVVYATALLRLEEQRGSKLRLAMALNGHNNGLKARIARILGETPERRRQMTPLSLAGVCAVLSVLLLPLPRVLANRAAAEVRVAVEAPHSHIVGQEAPQDESPSREAHRLANPLPSPQPLPESAATPAPVAKPAPKAQPATSPKPQPLPAVSAEVVVPALPATARFAFQDKHPVTPDGDYITEMRAAGYGDDLDKLIEMKIQGITPEFARSMEQLGFGKPTEQELISLKIFGVTSQTVQQLKAMGIAPAKLQDLISYQIFKVTPEYVSAMKAAGYSNIEPSKLITLKVQGITPEYARAIKQQYPDATLDQLIQLRIFHIDEAFIASAKQHGFDHLTIDKLVRLRISGLLDDSSQKAEKK